ncbi:MAG: hypothetical protein ACOX1V_02420 [Candidatus Iainarchaeum sp.]|jgi:predicted Zn-dependent protease
MWLLIDDNLWLDSVWVGQATSLFKKFRIGLKVKKVKLKDGKSYLSEININNSDEKRVIVTTGKINYNKKGAVLYKYEGISESIGGNTAVVTTKSLNRRALLVTLHEALHLKGIKHCQTNGCLMSFKLCSGELKYCLACEKPCKKIVVCGDCYGQSRENSC